MEKLDALIEQITEKCKSDRPAPCQSACPLHIDARKYVRLVSERKFAEALGIVRATLPFPAIIGRTCTRPCEQACRRKDVDAPVRICALKRFVTNYIYDERALPDVTGQKEVAVVGGGPAGLMAAHDLRLMGYGVTIFEKEAFLGGLLVTAIPDYRLPRDIVVGELALIDRMGIKVRLGTQVGKDIELGALRRDFSAVFLAPGQPAARKLGLPGEASEGVYYGLSFLKKVKQGDKVETGKRVVVIGGGNVAIDAARTARRLGAEQVTILYRRSKAEIPAARDEVDEAEAEGVDIRYLALPEKIVEKAGWFAGVEYAMTELGPPDERGRKTPVRTSGPASFIEADALIVAAGQAVDPSLVSGQSGLFGGPAGALKVDPVTLETGVPGVFAGGDATGRDATIVAALAAGRRTALSIDQYLAGAICAPSPEEDEQRYLTPFIKPIEGVPRQEREHPPELPLPERAGSFAEVVHDFTEEQAVREAGRCLDCSCGSCVADCEFLTKYGVFPKQIARIAGDWSGQQPEMAYACSICGLCKEVCPEGIDTGSLCMEVRERLVELGQGPLPGHQAVEAALQFARSDEFRFLHPDPRTGKCRSLFFPGCNLSGYSTDLVVSAYTYLVDRVGDVGIRLGCCGAPAHLLGKREAFGEVLGELESDMRRLGAEELILACPDCVKTLGQHIQVRSIYEVIAEIGLPDGAIGDRSTFSLHDSCTARENKRLRESVRTLIARMGYDVEESPYNGERARCCGAGGLLPYADFELVARVTKRRADEFHFDILTYCAACREAFALDKPSLHLLDLIFRPGAMEAKNELPKSGKKKRQSQTETRRAIADFIEKEGRAAGRH